MASENQAAKATLTSAMRDIPENDWPTFLDSLSREHEGWLVSVEIAMPKGRLFEVVDRQLKSIGGDREGVYVLVKRTTNDHTTYTIESPRRLVVRDASEGRLAFELESADGTRTLVSLRAPDKTGL